MAGQMANTLLGEGETNGGERARLRTTASKLALGKGR